MQAPKPKIRIVVMASGAGSTFAALVENAKSYEVVGLIVSRSGIGAIDFAQKLNIPFVVAKDDAQILSALHDFKPDYVVLAGYLKKISSEIIKKYAQRILNSHPSLLPQFGGQGMYGRKVHEAVIQAGVRKTGVTVHWVTEDYDSGPIIAQESLVVTPKDSAESIERKVKVCEKLLLSRVLNSFVS